MDDDLYEKEKKKIKPCTGRLGGVGGEGFCVCKKNEDIFISSK